MKRILLHDDSPERIALVREALAGRDVELVVVTDPAQTKLLLRANQPVLALASVEAFEGVALEMQRVHAWDCEQPVPLIVWSSRSSAEELCESLDPDLLVLDILALPLRSEALLAAVRRVLSPGQASPEAAGSRPPPPAPVSRDLDALGVATLLHSARWHGWSGLLEISRGADVVSRFWLQSGALVFAATPAGRDLMETARLEGRLEGVTVPQVSLASLEEEVGLLMALRAIGMHEVAGLTARTTERLLAAALRLPRCRVSARASETPAESFEQPLPVLPLLLAASEPAGAQRPELSLPLPEGTPVCVAGSLQLVEGVEGLSEDHAAAVARLGELQGEEPSLGELIEALSGSRAAGRIQARALALLACAVGDVKPSGRLFDLQTAQELRELAAGLHRLAGQDHFEALGLGRRATVAQVADAFRALSREHHPDRFFGRHPRVHAVAGVLFARLQEAYEVLGSTESRDAYLADVEKRGTRKQRTDVEQAKVAMAQAKIHLRHKRFAEAAESLREAVLHDPANVKARIEAPWVAFRADPARAGEAARELRTLVQEDDSRADAWYYLGRLSNLAEDHAAARRHLEKALTAHPSHVEAARELRLMDRRGQASSGDDEPKSKGLLARLRSR